MGKLGAVFEKDLIVPKSMKNCFKFTTEIDGKQAKSGWGEPINVVYKIFPANMKVKVCHSDFTLLKLIFPTK